MAVHGMYSLKGGGSYRYIGTMRSLCTVSGLLLKFRTKPFADLEIEHIWALPGIDSL
jgi:hypothetical protein